LQIGLEMGTSFGILVTNRLGEWQHHSMREGESLAKDWRGKSWVWIWTCEVSDAMC
jgi:hypothetical protein